MEPFALGFEHPLTFIVAFLPLLANVAILVYTLRYLPRDRISATFSLFLASLIGWQAFDCFVRTALTEEAAAFWRGLFWPAQVLAFPFGAHFALLYAGRERWAQSTPVLIALYAPAWYFATTANEQLILDPTWGWIARPDTTLRGHLFLVWGASMGLVVLGILGYAVRVWRDDYGRSEQARLIFFGMFFPVVLGVIFEAIFPNVLGIRQWPITSTTLSTFSLATVVALARHKLFDASSGVAAAAVLETMRDALLIATPERRLLFANRAALDRFGIDPNLVRAFPVEKLFPDAQAWSEFEAQAWSKAISGATGSAHDAGLKAADGRAVPMIVSTAPVPVSRWGQPGVLLLAHDVSELKKIQADLQKAKAEAEDANRSKSAFLANMSHELRTPLNAILGYTELTKEVLTDDGYDEVIPDLDKVHRAATHLLSLINDILDLSKIEAGRMEVIPEVFTVYDLVSDVRTMALPLAERKGNVLQVACAPTLGEVHLDKTKLRQILLNLLSNACKFTEAGQVSLSVEDKGTHLAFAVADTGLGMSEEQLGRLFQRFGQVHVDRDRYGGTGLGLVLCKKFAQMMGGDVHVTSEPGKGSVFTLEVPREVTVA